MVIWSGTSGSSNTGGRYEPATDTWTATSLVEAPSFRQFHTAVWTGSLMIVWGGYGDNDGGRYCVICTLGTYYRDADGDGVGDAANAIQGCSQPPGYVGGFGDCNDADSGVWSTPGETRDLLLVDNTTLAWTPPATPGATMLLYDLLRSANPSNFTTAATCVASDVASTTSLDGTLPKVGRALYYLVRAQDTCPAGHGTLGSGSDGVPRPGRACP
jgi:hypothetical protein